jgi:hypothetical protein
LALEPLADRLLPSVFAVLNTADSGEGSLRQAILDANAHPGQDTITFNIPGAGAHTIRPLSALPAITDPVVIDGTYQPGYTDRPLIVLDGSSAGSQASGLVIVAGDSTVRGLDIGNFSLDGIQLGTQLHSPGGNVVAGNYIGIDDTGTRAMGNNRWGVNVLGSPGNTVGGTGALDGNVISGNRNGGIYINHGDHSVVQANFIGIDATGTIALGNGPGNDGVNLSVGSDVTIGGTVPEARNVISGNYYGVLLQNFSSEAHVQGNYIGTDLTGTRPLGNTAGVWDAGQGDMIGGSAPGAGNLISGNRGAGVVIDGSRDIASGNWIGTDASGTQPLGNTVGVSVVGQFGGANNVIGGTAAGAGNIISGNAGDGVRVAADGTQVKGNYIGTDPTGTLALGNRGAGVSLLGIPYTSTVGGTTPGAGNVISGNAGDGIAITYAGRFQVQGNLIGTDVDGDQSLPNGGNGVSVGGGAVVPGVLIGGLGLGAGNVISGNDGDGVHVTSFGVRVLGNAIGTDLAETHALANRGNGVTVAGPNNTVGGTDPTAGNVLSGNGGSGLDISGDRNTVQGNYVGTDHAGTTALPNQVGISIEGSENTVGGTTAGTGNLVSGNLGPGSGHYGDGIELFGASNLVQGNYVGIDITGTNRLANGGNGVFVTGPGNIIGGTEVGARNVVAGNVYLGIDVGGPDASGNRVQGNYVGVDASGTHVLGGGVDLRFDATNNTIGGTTPGSRNVIAGTLQIFYSDTNLVQGNYIGVDPTGVNLLGSRPYGVEIFEGSDNTIGGTVAGAGNVIAGSSQEGILIRTSCQRTVVQGNYIGTDATGTVALGNEGGVFVGDVSNDTLIGGTVAGARNIISGNRTFGLNINSLSANTVIQGNYIGTDATGTTALGNGGAGIHLGNASGTLIGGTGVGAGNIISGNAGDGINLFASIAQNNRIEGNYIGTDVTGEAALPNGGNGVSIDGNNFLNTIGGAAPGAGNLISGNNLDGIFITGESAKDNRIEGNLIGTDARGTAALPNLDGVHLYDTSANTIGGTVTGAGNVISGNGRDGIMISVLCHDNLVQGNLIGTDASGTLPLGNGYIGVALADGASNNLIGGTVAGAPNTIAFNGNTGVLVDTGTGNAILGNAIFGHDMGLGIGLLHGGNYNQEFPTITAAFSGGGLTTIQGTLTSASSATFRLEVFVNSVCNYNGYGEGEQFLASFPLTTGGDGSATFTFTVAVAVDPGRFITATATDPGNNTSAFSACAEVSAQATSRVLISPTLAIPNGDAAARAPAGPSWAAPGPDTPGVETPAPRPNPLPANSPPVGTFAAGGRRNIASGRRLVSGSVDLFFSAFAEDLDG